MHENESFHTGLIYGRCDIYAACECSLMTRVGAGMPGVPGHPAREANAEAPRRAAEARSGAINWLSPLPFYYTRPRSLKPVAVAREAIGV